MGKYTNLEQDVFTIFSSDKWLNEGIKTFPTNYVAKNSGDEFVRVSVIPSGKGVNRLSLKGIFIIEIFIPAGGGVRRAFEIADVLNEYLEGSTLQTQGNATTQLGISTMLHNGVVDEDNPVLHKSTYSIEFNYFKGT